MERDDFMTPHIKSRLYIRWNCRIHGSAIEKIYLQPVPIRFPSVLLDLEPLSLGPIKLTAVSIVARCHVIHHRASVVGPMCRTIRPGECEKTSRSNGKSLWCASRRRILPARHGTSADILHRIDRCNLPNRAVIAARLWRGPSICLPICRYRTDISMSRDESGNQCGKHECQVELHL